MAQCINNLTSSKKSISCQKKIKTEGIDEYQNLNFHKKENFSKRPIFNQHQQDFKRKHCIMKPIKNNLNQLYTKVLQENKQNYTTEEKPTKVQFIQNLQSKRSGSAALNRNLLRLDSNKQNHLNQQEKHSNEESPKWKNLIKESMSTIFDCRKNQQKAPVKTSHSLMRVRSKQHLVFCASKLPKDFFGESILGENCANSHEQRFIFGSHGNLSHDESSLKKGGLKQFVFGQNQVQKLMFSEEKARNKQDSNDDPEFTFRKQKSKKNLDSKQETLQQTPRFSHKRQITQNLRKNQSLPSLHKNVNVFDFLEAKKKIHKNYLSKQQLKL